MKELFKKYALGLSLTATMMTAALPAMAGECTAADKAQITKSQIGEMRIGDFSKSSIDCLEHFANGLSRTDLVLVAESDSYYWRQATIEAAKKLQSEGKPAHVFFTNDTDGLDNTAATAIWANGVERGFVPVKINDGLRIDHIGPVQHAPAQKVIAMMHKKGSQVWDTYLKVPSLALNN